MNHPKVVHEGQNIGVIPAFFLLSLRCLRALSNSSACGLQNVRKKPSSHRTRPSIARNCVWHLQQKQAVSLSLIRSPIV